MTSSTDSFTLHQQLAQDSLALCTSATSTVRVVRDARFPWLVLVPQLPGLKDLIDLGEADYATVMGEVRQVSGALQRVTACEKLNIASLGNQVPQLHIHIIARFSEDAAWPGPVWGSGPPEPLDAVPRWARDVQAALGDAGWSAP
ncbi:MAG: HIT family protein [Devosiaceae bacterium]|nr:HIT family protein [Devosiaceae bacterium MH13]